jgi:alpha-glucosidase
MTFVFPLLAGVALTITPAMAQEAAPAADVSQASQAAPKFQTIASADSPGKVLHVDVMLSGDGNLSYQITRNGQTVIAPSRLGLILANAPKFDRYFALETADVSAHDDTWEQPWGERRFTRNHYNELRVNVVQKTWDDRKMTVVFRMYDDGLGFRYEFPDQPQLHKLEIMDELTEFAVADKATAWWDVAGEWNREEYLYQKTPLDEVSEAQTPMTLKTDKGLYISFHEAALVDYAAMWLRRVDGQRLKTRLAPSAMGAPVVRDAPFPTPWRTLQITDSAAALYNGSDLILNLNEPNKLGDVSWVKPYKYVGIWWGMHLNTWTWEAGPRHGATTANTKAYIDFAAKNGFRGVLVEGWNKGWEDWFGKGYNFSFTEAYPDFDLTEISAYGLKKGVHLVGHNETSGNVSVYEPQMESGFKLYEKYGVDSVKTGYVADAGGARVRAPDGSIRYAFNDSQEMVRHYLLNVQTAAKYHIAIDTHEPIKDTGLRRTYPNWVSREGQRGMEYNAWGDPQNPPEHEANLVFTRMLSGPMDFTPGILSLQGQGKPIASTQAKQLALYVVLYSPIQMAADLPENYAKYPKPFQFIKDVPTDWEQSIALNGEPGDFATIVRKDKASDDWYFGAVTDETERSVDVPLTFLEPGRSYTAQIYRDGPNAGLTGDARFDIVIEDKAVTAADTLKVRMAPGGGEAIRFKALGKSKAKK